MDSMCSFQRDSLLGEVHPRGNPPIINPRRGVATNPALSNKISRIASMFVCTGRLPWSGSPRSPDDDPRGAFLLQGDPDSPRSSTNIGCFGHRSSSCDSFQTKGVRSPRRKPVSKGNWLTGSRSQKQPHTCDKGPHKSLQPKLQEFADVGVQLGTGKPEKELVSHSCPVATFHVPQVTRCLSLPPIPGISPPSPEEVPYPVVFAAKDDSPAEFSRKRSKSVCCGWPSRTRDFENRSKVEGVCQPAGQLEDTIAKAKQLERAVAAAEAMFALKTMIPEHTKEVSPTGCDGYQLAAPHQGLSSKLSTKKKAKAETQVSEVPTGEKLAEARQLFAEMLTPKGTNVKTMFPETSGTLVQTECTARRRHGSVPPMHLMEETQHVIQDMFGSRRTRCRSSSVSSVELRPINGCMPWFPQASFGQEERPKERSNTFDSITPSDSEHRLRTSSHKPCKVKDPWSISDSIELAQTMPSPFEAESLHGVADAMYESIDSNASDSLTSLQQNEEPDHDLAEDEIFCRILNDALSSPRSAVGAQSADEKPIASHGKDHSELLLSSIERSPSYEANFQGGLKGIQSQDPMVQHVKDTSSTCKSSSGMASNSMCLQPSAADPFSIQPLQDELNALDLFATQSQALQISDPCC